jgi:outer membrane protein assembly factor BamB
MKNISATLAVIVGCAVLLGATPSRAQDWPQWRGPHRDAKATGFKAPGAWPKELTKKWKVTVGEGVATPALVGDRLYVFSREKGKEVIRCLKAADGEKVWEDSYEAEPPTRPATGFKNEFVGPRSSPAVAEGKVVTLGVRGILSCYDADKGTKLWRKNDLKGWPRFFTSSSPLIVNGQCIAQLGKPDDGGVVAYELDSGKEKWKWPGDGPAYASPVVMDVGGTKVLVAETSAKIVGLNLADGKLLWETPFAVRGRGGYNASTPLVASQTLIYAGSGRGTQAVKLEKSASKVTAKELWSNKNGVQFNTAVLAKGFLFGLSENNTLYCINAKDGETAWTVPAPKKGGGRGRGPSGYGSIVAAGDYLVKLTPDGQVVVFEPSGKEYKEVAKYKVADGDTYAYPIVSGNRVFVKDRTSLTLWTIE